MRYQVLILLALIIGVFIPSPHAAEIAPQSCDSNYWRQLSSRAWLEAEREIMQNQNLIFKPDSVLQYTCFCLLYTSPSPRDGATSRMPSSA